MPLNYTIARKEFNMNNALKDWLYSVSNEFNRLGISVNISDGYLPESYSVNLDSIKFVGTICFWPSDKFEFQFNSCDTGDVILLDTLFFNIPAELESYLNELVFVKLSAL